MSENMKIYNSVRQVPKEALKDIKGGRLKGMSDINPMWRIKMLTELFGMCGIGWKIEIVDRRLEKGSADQIACFVDVNLYIKVDGKWSDGIPGMGGSAFVTKEASGLYTNDECFKMAYTDAISVSCKSLGFAADIYYANDRTKYSDQEETAEPKQDIPPAALKAKYQLGKGDLNGFEEWVSAQQANGRNFKDMDDILAQAMLKKKQAEKDGKKNE